MRIEILSEAENDLLAGAKFLSVDVPGWVSTF
jgi:hypothetical protein